MDTKLDHTRQVMLTQSVARVRLGRLLVKADFENEKDEGERLVGLLLVSAQGSIEIS
jgi:hypothetical protein